ncbi:angiotensin-converting enzyme 2 [Ooceraea biroi]|uniref:angiotensin-converting enzyme 2 n=1 Tax=Ooceraea biroi TaxID=2015173 RepID=UPI0005B7D02C|nr:angiotensin-converting enzyme 2 [Ooceraea biroi]
MLSKWSWLVLNLIVYASALPAKEETKALLELTQLDYEDACYNTASVQWSLIISPSNKTLSTWEAQQHKYAEFKKSQKNLIIEIIQKEKLEPFRYVYDVIEKPGDTLLKDEDWKKFIHFVGVAELQQSAANHVNGSQNRSREDVEHLLSHNGKLEDKQAAWSAWYQQLTPLVTNYTNNLLLVAEAAKENDAENVERYWEMLTGYPDGYDRINSEWSRINNLHKKVLKFVSTNLAKKYGITINQTIPAHLLGSLRGYDWTDISSDALPYSDLIYGIKKNLWKKKYVGQSLYKIASSLSSILLKEVPEAEFWENSEFNRQCPSVLLNLCRYGKMRVSTCSKASMSNFLTAHEDVGKIAFNQMSSENMPILNTANRYSGLEESVSILFGILSANPAWLNHTHLSNDVSNNEQRMIASLMITALHVLPRLAYYYAADLWRINAIEKNITDSSTLISSWWKYRQEYEGVSSIDMDSPTFLDDSDIIRNKPYLPKILGIMVAFQLYEYTLESTEVRYDDIDGKLMKGEIIKMIQRSGEHSWQDDLNKFLEIDDISADALVSYFTPLEEFIEENEDVFEYKSGAAADKELEELEKRILHEINNPTTTPLPTTATYSSTVKASLPKTTSSVKSSNEKPEKSLESKSSVYVSENQSKNPASSLPTEVPHEKSLLTPDLLDEQQNDTPKINTSKAVWAVSAVLIAIVVICIIVIFGRQRCRKTPKNRRYV